MEKILHHFLFRISQGIRVFNLNPKIGFSVVILVGILCCIKLPEYYPLITFFLTIGFHFRRTDIRFLQKIFVKTWRLIIVMESLIVYTVLTSINIFYHWEKWGFLLMLLILNFAWVYPKRQKNIVFKWNFIPDDLFEWKSFFRRNSVLIIIAYILLLASAYHLASLIFLSFLLIEHLSNVYSDNENKEFFVSYFQKHSFTTKIKRNLLFLNLFLLPIGVVFAIFNWDTFQYFFLYLLIINIYAVLIITRKYKLYHHKNASTYFDMGDSLLYFISSLLIVPGIWIIYTNTNESKNIIQKYVGD